jgi:hypothetical protein
LLAGSADDPQQIRRENLGGGAMRDQDRREIVRVDRGRDSFNRVRG